uniref:DEAD/DEAH box helicase n=1 Tax=Rhodoblastus sp. TaxID=1962975 RepID=UPI003F9EA3A4
RLAAFQDAHIYHYNHYEVTALKRLTQRYGVGESMLDHLLRGRKFVDLYRVVQQGLVASESGYSLKDLEAFYMEKRTGEVATAGDSIVAYENWLESREQNILDEIKRYNEIDCRSTKGLRDWLIEVRPDGAPWFVHEEAPAPPEDLIDVDRQALRDKLDAARNRLGPEVADLLFELNAFHGRADKPAWWEYFDRQSRDTDELIDDLESLGGLTAISPPDGLARKYAYPKQETKLRANARVCLRGLPGTVTIVEMDRRKRQVALKGSKRTGPLPGQLDLVPSGPIKNDVLRVAVDRVTASFLADDGQFPAIGHFLARRPPRLKGVLLEDYLKEPDDHVDAAVSAVVALDNSCLPIQGPPGTGKTYVSAKAIRELVRCGKRVAVSSNAHKAIDNLLLAMAGQAREAGERISIAKKISIGADKPDDAMITATTSNDDSILQTASVVGGTAWLFARPEMTESFDHVFIDEAGQVSIANLVAIAGAAKNIVLVGDQMQLPQPVQGVHPGESGLSTLDYLMQDQRTITPDRGIFLPLSRRMHPAVCTLISDLVYDGRLSSDAGAARHRIDGADSLPNFGVLFEAVEHSGNSQSSEEEADKIVALHAALLGATFTDRQGQQRTMGIDDILVVSPYNAQVNLLSERLPAGARVGTVDRFQGQEAPVSLISMATSSAQELPRDVAFLFSLNRLNVAISRAQALAIVVASPKLLDVQCSTLEEMKLVNALCAVNAYSRPKPA